MKKFLVMTAALVALTSQGNAASIVNNDSEARTVVVTEGGSQQELSLAGGERAEFCPNGCFVSLSGERETLLGTEQVEISGGKMRLH
ncbi:MAG: hypothetical protein ABIK36_02440 [Pseudomonadota bacterium]|jgi:hypothetical protein